MSIGGNLQRSNKKQPAAAPPPPATVTAANDGVSLSGTIVQLGQSVGAVGNPAILINDREIPMGVFAFEMLQGANRFFRVDPQGQHFFLGDVDASQGSAFLDIDNSGTTLTQLSGGAGNTVIGDTSSLGNGTTIGVKDSGLQPLIGMTRNGNFHFLIDFTLGVYELGDDGNALNGGLLQIRDIQRTAFLGFNLNNHAGLLIDDPSSALAFGDVGGQYLGVNIGISEGFIGEYGGPGNAMVYMDWNLGLSQLGDAFNYVNGNWFEVDDLLERFRLTTGGAGQLAEFDQLNGSMQLSIQAGDRALLANGIVNKVYQFGDLDNTANQSKLVITDSAQTLELETGGATYITVDGVAQTAKLGSGLNLTVDETNQIVNVRDVLNNDYLEIDVANSVYQFGDIDNGVGWTLAMFSGIGIANFNIGAFTPIDLNVTTGVYRIGDIGNAANNAVLSVNDTTEQFLMTSSGGIGVGGIKTNAPTATGAGLWLLGKNVAAASVLDATQYLEVMVDGVAYKLALAV